MPLVPSLACALFVLGATVPGSLADKPAPATGIVPAYKLAAPSPAPSSALSPMNDQAISTAADDQVAPRVANILNSYFVAFETHQYGTDYDIVLASLNATGDLLATRNLTGADTQPQSAPDLAVNTATYEAMVVFEHLYGPGDHDLYAQRVDYYGVPQGGGWTALAMTGAEERTPAIVYNPNVNEYLVVWAAGTEPTRDIRAQRVTALGNATGPVIEVAANTEDDRAPRVAYDPVGHHYLVAWNRYVGSDYDVFGRLLDDGGNAVGAQFEISGYTLDEPDPCVAANWRTGEFLVAFNDVNVANGGTYDVRGQRVSGEGVRVGPRFQIGTSVGGSRTSPSIAYCGGANEYEVVYDWAFTSTDHDVGGMRLHPDGTPASYEFWVTNLGSETLFPAVTSNLAGDGYEVVWNDARNLATTGWDIYGSLTPLPAAVLPPAVAGSLQLSPPRPNPAPGAVELTVSGGRGTCRIEVLDIAGRLVRTLEGGASPETRVRWDGRRADGAHAAPGLYLVRAGRGAERITRRVVLVE
jgi:hypothetical protein